MNTTATLNEQSIVCRTCLKVVTSSGFVYLDDENGGAIKDVGTIRNMLQFCIPELDLYVSDQPVVCYQCLRTIVQVYNFKIKCLSCEDTIRSYVARNKLHEFNQVNLNSVLMDDLKLKSEKIQIESRIKDMMLQELPEGEQQESESQMIMKELNLASSKAMESCFKQMIPEREEATISNEDEIKIKEEPVPANSVNNSDRDVKESTDETPMAVGKDLFAQNEPEAEKKNESSKHESLPESSPIILNNDFSPENGRIVIKIDKRRLQNLGTILAHKKPTSESLAMTETPALEAVSPSEETSSCTPQIVSVESIKPENESSLYNCKKCSFATDDVIKIYDHNRRSHSFDYTCQHCPFSTLKVELLGKHMSMFHPESLNVYRNQNFKVAENYACSMCPFSVKNIELLRSHHLAAHGRSDVEKAPIVLNNAVVENILKQEPKILKRLEYTCDVCPYTTKDKSNLRKHLFTHGTKPLKCDHCAYKCVSPYQLRRHQKQKHIGKHAEPRPRNRPYELPDLKKEKREAMDRFKITLDTIKREFEKEITT